MTEAENDRLAEEALDAACRAIQDRLGISDGLLASLFFTGDNLETVLAVFRQYIQAEREGQS